MTENARVFLLSFQPETHFKLTLQSHLASIGVPADTRHNPAFSRSCPRSPRPTPKEPMEELGGQQQKAEAVQDRFGVSVAVVSVPPDGGETPQPPPGGLGEGGRSRAQPPGTPGTGRDSPGQQLSPGVLRVLQGPGVAEPAEQGEEVQKLKFLECVCTLCRGSSSKALSWGLDVFCCMYDLAEHIKSQCAVTLTVTILPCPDGPVSTCPTLPLHNPTAAPGSAGTTVPALPRPLSRATSTAQLSTINVAQSVTFLPSPPFSHKLFVKNLQPSEGIDIIATAIEGMRNCSNYSTVVATHMLNMFVVGAVSSLEDVPRMIRCLYRNLRYVRELLARVTLNNILCQLCCSNPDEVTVSLLYCSPLCNRAMRRAPRHLCRWIFHQLARLLSGEDQFRQRPAMAFFVELLDGLDLAEMDDAALPLLWRCIQAEGLELRRLAFRGLLSLLKMARKMQSLLPDMVEWLQDARRDVRAGSLLLLRNILSYLDQKGSNPIALQLAERLLPRFDDTHHELAGGPSNPSSSREAPEAKSQGEPRSPWALTMSCVWERRSKHCSELGEVAAYVPDLILSEDLRHEARCVQNFHGVLLFADVSGFTALTEKFSQSVSLERGADELTQTLNDYMGDIVEELLGFGGDILKFAGDAVLVLWRVRETQLRDTISLVLQCCRQIQEKYSVRDTDVGLKLRLKIGISAGHMSLLTVGDRKEQHFLILGKAVGEVWQAQNLASASDIILSASCWELCNQSQVKSKRVKGQGAVKVTGVQRMSVSEHEDLFSKFTRAQLNCRSLEMPGVLRPAVTLAPHRAQGKVLRKYIPASVLRKIDDRQPLACLSELRPVTCLFVKLQFAAKVNLTQICKAIQDSSVLISEILRPHKGEINKISMFDKGCTLLCVFGLPGGKLPCESVCALESAIKISTACSGRLGKIEAVSVGVTSGTAFCGVVGHRVRHEYTVMGQKVNLAARLMEHYPGLVSCDAATYAASRLPRSYFKELPKAQMKGVGDPGTVYQYLGMSQKLTFGLDLMEERSEYGPLLGREEEITLFESALKAYGTCRESSILAFEGVLGSGKSHLLTELASLGQAAGHRVVAVELTELNLKQVYSALRMVLAMALGLQACQSCSARQLVLQAKLQGLMAESSYCLLNDVFLVKFPLSTAVSQMSGTQRQMELELVLKKVLQKTVEEDGVVFVIDNAHCIDSPSWSLMWSVLRDVSIFMVMSFTASHCRRQRLCQAAVDILKLPKTSCVRLGELKPSAVVQKACQELGVVSLPQDLETLLTQRSYGIPYYCEELLHYLLGHDMLLFHPLGKDEKREDKWESLFTSVMEASTTAAARSSSAGKDRRVCTMRPDVTLQNTVLPPTLKGIALAELDSMKPSEQMVLKCAAILGPLFSTELLFHILPGWSRAKLNKVLNALVRCNILKWLNAAKGAEESSVPTEGSGASLEEESDAQKSSVEESKQRARLESGVLAFCAPLLQEAAYELWPKGQRVALHHKCAAFLERHAHKCQCCGGGDFVAFHRLALGSTQEAESGEEHGSDCSWRNWEASLATSEEMKSDELPASTDASSGVSKEKSFLEEIFRAAKQFLAKTEWMPKVPSKTQWTQGVECSCSCKAIVDLVLVPLAQHYMAVGNDARAFYYLLEGAAAYLHVSDNYLAFRNLKKAEVLRTLVAKKGNALACFEEATLLSLKGEVCYHMGQTELAKTMIRKALSLLKRKFPTTSTGAALQLVLEKSEHASHKKNRDSSVPQEAGRQRLPWLFRQSHCLSLLRQLFSLESASGSRRLSRLAALMKVNTAEESEDASHVLLSYLEYALCCQNLGCREEWLQYGRAAMQLSAEVQLFGGGVLNMASFAQALSHLTLSLGNLPLSVDVGYRAERLCMELQKPDLGYVVLRTLFTALFLQMRYPECEVVLRRLEKQVSGADEIVGQACFFCCCLDLLLDAGWQYKSFEECRRFVEQNEANCLLQAQSSILLGLYSSLALWFARLGQWDNFQKPFEKAKRLLKSTGACLVASQACSRLLECHSLVLKKDMEHGSWRARESCRRALRLAEEVFSRCSTSPVFYPRVYHLKAYIFLMLGNEEQSLLCLNQGLQACEDHGNLLEKTWLEMSTECWFTGKGPLGDLWLKTAPHFPHLNQAKPEVCSSSNQMGKKGCYIHQRGSNLRPQFPQFTAVLHPNINP
ncbi:adenylate cyclase type 10-like [Rhea pennata]|uniref:adenylate cyclase type 10-like n=1 Tax=Rhea pennata TaxID=8795 RepID=UPI002E27127D